MIPELHGETEVILNAETTGLRWWATDRPIGWAYCLPRSGRQGYLPVRHASGENLPLERVRAWLRSLHNVCVTNVNTKFDLHMTRVDDVDLVENTGNIFDDVAFHAALLDDNRQRFNLDALSLEWLAWDVTKDGLGQLPPGLQNEGQFKDLSPEKVAPYAIRNVLQVRDLAAAMRPHLAQQGLLEVLDLERAVLPIVVEMEKNGTYIDLDLLAQWREQIEVDLEDVHRRIFQTTGLRVNPKAPTDMAKLFEALHLPVESWTPTGKPSFTHGVLRAVDHPVIKDVLEAKQLLDLKSKYTDKYANAARADGWLRFNLHQLRFNTDESDHRVGTVSGRFSAAGDKFGGYNPQQVVAVEKQLERGFCPKYVVRRLFRPAAGATWCSADARQIEYRLFAHYANDPQILAAYAKDPLMDYHKVVQDLLLPLNPNLNRKRTKNTNFAKIYAAGLLKFALMLDVITEREFNDVLARRFTRREDQLRYLPKLQPALDVMNAYDQMFPRVAPLIQRAADTAKQRGYVRTLLGRRARLVDRFHSALNRVIQGGAADINKRVLVEVYKQRKALGLTFRLTVHDELDTDIPDASVVPQLQAILDTQYYDLRVPILWDIGTGANWAEAK